MEFMLGVAVGIIIGFLWGVWRATQGFIERIMNEPEEIKDLMSRMEKINRDAEQELSLLEKESKQLNQENNNNHVRAEFHQGVCYLYDHNDNFLAQGSTAIDAIAEAKKRFPEMAFSFRLNEAKESVQ
jgi:hypothetical protein